MKIAIGCDHAGYALKEKLKEQLLENRHQAIDYGTHGEESVDYPDFGHAVAEAMQNNLAELGIVICGSGNGINMSVNKHGGIRSALCWTPEIAALARKHNDANVLALPAGFITTEEALKITEAFLEAEFEGGRHQRRVNKISATAKTP
ncbi:MAG: ribose 5-phosphate isomerase B [Owenweeksia sp.]|nr:ribose 5-phosphate isomerase B [Owenweeksia sp.]